MRYLAASPGTLKVVDLEGLAAVYHRASAQTHLLAEPAPSILSALDRPLTVEELLAELGAEGEADALRERLAELQAIGLVEAV